jgi:hypothetical protein
MRRGWGMPPAVDQHHTTDTRVAQPGARHGCWATVSQESHIKLLRPRTCRNLAQPNRCTCRAHRTREAEAQALRAEIAMRAAEAAE